jgi:hypothetical protein
MNNDVITCLGYARAWLNVLSASLGASWVGRAGIDGNLAAQSRRGKRAPERVYVNAAVGLGRHGAACNSRVYARLYRRPGDHARRTTMRGVAA